MRTSLTNKPFILLFVSALWSLELLAGLNAQQRRPIPYPVIMPPQFERAVRQGTRTTSGRPGPAYWTNTADYTIEAQLDPDETLLRGRETVTYHNNSPNENGCKR